MKGRPKKRLQLLTWFFLFKNEKKELRTGYDCSLCTNEKNQWFKKRACFHQDYGQEIYSLEFPVIDEESRRPTGSVIQVVNLEDVLEWLYDLNEKYYPDTSPFELLRRFFPSGKKEICLTAFVTFDLGSLIDLEDSCFSYHCLPYEGGLLDQPLYLIEAFNVIRSEKNKYDNKKFEDGLKDIKSNTGNVPVITPPKRR